MPRTVWTTKDLNQLFTYLLAETTAYSRVLFCIDGLDECIDDQYALTRDLRSFAGAGDRVKVCCASRSDDVFQDALGLYPSLKMQHYNWDDMKSYCEEKLGGTRAAELVDAISRKADGVFLWVYIVTNDLKRAARRDCLETLWHRLEECPQDMSDLFMHMINKMDPYYARHPKPYLQIICHDNQEELSGMSLLHLILTSLGSETLESYVRTAFDESQMAAVLTSEDALESEIIARCAGLVEVQAQVQQYSKFEQLLQDDCQSPLTAHWNRSAVKGVSFIHRTVFDFLRNTPDGQALLHGDMLPTTEVVRLYLLAKMCLNLYQAENLSLRWMHKCHHFTSVMCRQYATSEYLSTEKTDRWQLLTAFFTRLESIALRRASELCGTDGPLARRNLFRLVTYWAPELEPGAYLLWCNAVGYAADAYVWPRIDLLPSEQQLYVTYLACLNAMHGFMVSSELCIKICGKFASLMTRNLRICYAIETSYSVEIFEGTLLTFLVSRLLEVMFFHMWNAELEDEFHSCLLALWDDIDDQSNAAVPAIIYFPITKHGITDFMPFCAADVTENSAVFLLRVERCTLKKLLRGFGNEEPNLFHLFRVLAASTGSLEMSPPGLTRYFVLSKKQRDAMTAGNDDNRPWYFPREFKRGSALDNLCLEIIKDHVEALSEVELNKLRDWGWKIVRQTGDDGVFDHEMKFGWNVGFPYELTSEELGDVTDCGMPRLHELVGGRIWPRQVDGNKPYEFLDIN